MTASCDFHYIVKNLRVTPYEKGQNREIFGFSSKVINKKVMDFDEIWYVSKLVGDTSHTKFWPFLVTAFFIEPTPKSQQAGA